MNKVQTALLKMMVDIDKVLKENNIMYFIDSGNAVGAVRHKGFIPWDDDIDIVIKRKDVKKFEKAIESMEGYYLQKPYSIDWLSMYYKVRKEGTTVLEPGWSETRVHHGLFIDVFVIENYPNSSIGRKIYDTIAKRMNDLIWIHYENRDKSGEMVIFKCATFFIKIGNALLDIITPKKCECVTQRTCFKSSNTYSKEYVENTVEMVYENIKLPLCNGYDQVLRIKYGDYMKLPPEDERKGHHIIAFYDDIDYKDYYALKKKESNN